MALIRFDICGVTKSNMTGVVSWSALWNVYPSYMTSQEWIMQIRQI